MFNDKRVKSVLASYYPKSAIRCLEEAETKFIVLQERQKSSAGTQSVPLVGS